MAEPKPGGEPMQQTDVELAMQEAAGAAQRIVEPRSAEERARAEHFLKERAAIDAISDHAPMQEGIKHGPYEPSEDPLNQTKPQFEAIEEAFEGYGAEEIGRDMKRAEAEKLREGIMRKEIDIMDAEHFREYDELEKLAGPQAATKVKKKHEDDDAVDKAIAKHNQETKADFNVSYPDDEDDTSYVNGNSLDDDQKDPLEDDTEPTGGEPEPHGAVEAWSEEASEGYWEDYDMLHGTINGRMPGADMMTDEQRGTPSQEEQREQFEAEVADEQQRVRDFEAQNRDNPGGSKIS